MFLGRKHRHNKQTNVCVVDGCDCATLIKYDNLYDKIKDEDTGKSLWELYWQNPVTGEPEAFIAKEKVTNGRKMKVHIAPNIYISIIYFVSGKQKKKKSVKQTQEDCVTM